MKAMNIWLVLLLSPVLALDQCIEPCLLYANGNTLVRLGSQSNSWEKYPVPQELSSNQIGSVGILYKEKRLLWYDIKNKSIVSSSFTPNFQTSVISTLQIGNLVDFSIDWNHNLIYWTDDVYDSIRAATLDGAQQSLVHHVTKPSLIEYSSSDNRLYFVLHVGHTYYIRSSIPGKSNSIKSLAFTSQKIYSMAIDPDEERVYYIQADPNFKVTRVYSVAFSSNAQPTPTFHYEAAVPLHSLALHQRNSFTYLYFIKDRKDVKEVQVSDAVNRWPDSKIKLVSTLNVYGSSSDQLLVIQNATQPVKTDFCNKVGCSQTCFYAKSTSDFSCGCQLGYELGSDSKSCKKAAIGATLYTFPSSSSASSQTLLQLDVLGKYIVEGKATLIDNPIPRKILRISKLAASKEFVYFTDNVNKWLCKAEIGTGKMTILRTSFKYADAWKMKYDHVSKLLFLIPSNKNEVAIADENGDTLVLKTFASNTVIQDIVLIPLENLFAVLSNYQSKSRVNVFNMDGTQKYAREFQHMATSFTYHKGSNKIYWHNSHTKVIHDWTMGVSYTNVFLNNIGDVRMMFSSGGDDAYVYYETSTGDVYRFKAVLNSQPELVMKMATDVDLDKIAVQGHVENSNHECSVNNGDCSHFCLRLKGNTTAKCACPDGMTLNDGKTCDEGQKIICEHSSSQVACGSGKVIRIKGAIYGRLESSVCQTYAAREWHCASSVSLAVVQSKCEDRNSCTLSASKSLFGDPCVSIVKYLQVDYQCVWAVDKCDAPNCLYHIQGASIYRKSITASNFTTIISGLNDIIYALAVDQDEDAMFWVSPNAIHRSTLRATKIHKLQINAYGSPRTLAIDRTSKLLYWTAYNQDVIFVSTYDATKTAMLTQARGGNPTTVAVDETNRKLFWMHVEIGKTYISSLSLTNVNATSSKLVLSWSYFRNAFRIDPQTKSIFYQDNTGVWVTGYDGKNSKKIYSGTTVRWPIVLKQDAGLLYIPSSNALAAYKYDASSRSLKRQLTNDVIIPGLMSAYWIVFPDVVPTASTPACKESVCGPYDVCTGLGSCTCAIGANRTASDTLCMELQNPSFTMITIPRSRRYNCSGTACFYYHENSMNVFDVYRNGVKKNILDFGSMYLKYVGIISVVQDIKDNSVVYAYDSKSQSLLEYNLDSRTMKVVAHFPNWFDVTSLAYDYIEKRFFAIHNGSSIYQFTAKSEPMIAELKRDNRQEQFVSIDPRKRLIFYISNNVIYRSDYPGNEEIIIRTLDKSMPVLAFQVDIYGERMYWVQNKQINSCKQDGNSYLKLEGTSEIGANITNFQLLMFSDIKITRRYIYWSISPLAGAVYKFDKNTGKYVDRIVVSEVDLSNFDGGPLFIIVQEKEPGVITIPEYQGNTSQCDVNNGGCSHVCNADQSNAAVCKCPDRMKMNPDKRTCVYDGGYCETQQPCSNSQICVDHPTTFQCIQRTGCLSSPCLNSASCEVVSGNVIKCRCATGFYGDRCQYKQHCLKSTTCLNGGSCQESAGRVVCTCPDSYTGLFCEKTVPPVDACTTRLCQNGGSCQVIEAGNLSAFKCVCPYRYTGKFCDLRVGPCNTTATCKNGGSCLFQYSSGAIQCICPYGYSGPLCEISVPFDACSLVFCQSSHNCVVDATGEPRCVCPAKRTGPTCEAFIGGDPVHRCTSIKCQNGGSCQLNDTGNAICVCPETWSGSECQINDVCSSTNPCQNEGSCQNLPDGEFKCHCKNTYGGERCENPHSCYQLPCQNGGSCAIIDASSYTCLCEKFYTGDHCEIYFEDNVVSAVLKPDPGQQITKAEFQRTMAIVYTEYCSQHDCFLEEQQQRRKRAAGQVAFQPEHIVVVQGYPKDLGTGEVRVLYTVLIPKTAVTGSQVFVTTKSIINGAVKETTIVRNQLGSTVASAEKYTQNRPPTSEESNSQLILIAACAGGGTAVLIVLIVTLGCCYVKRRGGDKNLHIQMTDQNGRISVVAAKLNNNDNKPQSIDTDRYTNTDQITRPTPFHRATIGLAPPPPDYLKRPPAHDLYEGIDDYQQSAADNYGNYLESGDININVSRTASTVSYAILDPEEAALERERSRVLSTDTIYSHLDESSVYAVEDNYMSLKNY